MNPPDSKQEKVASAPKKTPAEWAKELAPNMRAAFASADYLHGWSEHEYHHAQSPLLMTRECFDAALKAAGEFPTSAPHAEALGEPAKDRFKAFKPLPKKNDTQKEADK